MKTKILSASSISELNKRVESYQEMGWEAIGSHQVAQKNQKLRYAGSQHRDTQITNEYSITMQREE